VSHGCGSFGGRWWLGAAWLGVSEASVPYGPELRIPDLGKEASVEEYGLDALEASAEGVLAGLGPLVAGLARLVAGAAGAVTLDAMELLVEEQGRELLRGVVQAGLDVQAAGEVRLAGVTGADGVVRARAERGHRRRVVTRFGEVVAERMRYRPAVPGAGSFFPRDGVLNLPLSGYSWGLRRLVVMFARECSYEQAGEFLLAVTGVAVGRRQLEEIVAAAAADAAAFCDAPAPVPGPAARAAWRAAGWPGEPGLLPLVLSADGKGVPMRPESRRARTRAPGRRARTYEKRTVAGEKKGFRRMAQVSCVSDVIPAVRTPEEVMASCRGGNGKRRKKKQAPGAVNRRYRADIAADRSVPVKWLFDEAGRRDPGRERDWIVLVDGDKHQIALIQAEAAARGVTITILIDLIHVIEYLWKAGWAFHDPRDPAIEKWAAARALDILRGHSAQVADDIARLAADHPPQGTEHARNIAKTLSYLRAKQPYLGYPEALAKGWPVATGVIEGACRHLVKDRMDITGARWSTTGAQAILWHRAIHASHHDHAYWTYHLQQEHRRNHLDHYNSQDNHSLAA
jgi:hypothetical protein